MIAAALALAASLVAAPPTVVQVPVGDPVLPSGPLLAMGATTDGEIYVDHPSFGRSDLPGLIRMTAVIVRPGANEPAPLWVALLWVDCSRRVYQLSSGRRYDDQGRQTSLTAFVRDRPIVAGSGPDQVAAVYCPLPPQTPDSKRVVANYQAALERSRSVVPTPPGGAPQ